MKRSVFVALLAAVAALAAALPARADTPAATIVSSATLPDIGLAAVQNAVLPGTISDDRGFMLGGVGSDIWRSPADPAGELWMMTDRGPNTQISVGGANRRTFPVPDFTPLILKVKIKGNALELLQTIPIVGTAGNGVSGLPNLSGKDEIPYNFDATTPISYNQSGLDTEGLVRTTAGEFWVAEENRPSLLHIAADGEILRRYIPSGVSLPEATYPVSSTLPAIFDKRKANRGFESLALSPDQSLIYTIVQSPLSNPTKAAGEASRNTRILAFDITTGLPVAEYVYRFEPVASFDPGAGGKQDEMKISGLLALDANTLLVLERTDPVARVYKISLAGATNILSSTWDLTATSPSLEQLADPATAGVTVVSKALAVDLEALPNMPDKIEGITLVGPNALLVANDNDFNIAADGSSNGAGTKSKVLQINAPLTAALPNGVAAGDVAQTSAVLWARASAPGTTTFSYSTSATFASVITGTVNVTDTLVPARLAIAGLTAATRYYYRASDAAGATASGTFRTPAAVGAKVGLRLGISGDWRGELSPYPAIANAPARNLDLFVEFGDTIYADYESPALPGVSKAQTIEQYRVKHDEVYSTRALSNTWAALRSSTAVLSTIDDHEVINDFAGGAAPASDPRFAGSAAAYINDTPLYENGLQAFQEYNPVADERYGDTGDLRTANERRLYRYRTYGSDGAVFMLDTRSFRDSGLAGVLNLNDSAAVAAFLQASFNPNRTLLGAQQFADLKRDLQDAQQKGVVWKFVLVPEPIQNLGVIGASDRYEGYAAERTALLKFIKESGITNVVFVTADIHGTLVNNLTYQTAPGQPQIATGAFEISTGSVAFDAPFGPTVIALARSAGLLSQTQVDQYNALPRAAKDAFVATLLNNLLTLQGYDTLGLVGSSIKATLVQGTYAPTHTFGWTEFTIDKDTQQLRVTTYGIDSYTRAEVEANPDAIKARTPAVVSEFTVDAVRGNVYLPLVVK